MPSKSPYRAAIAHRYFPPNAFTAPPYVLQALLSASPENFTRRGLHQPTNERKCRLSQLQSNNFFCAALRNILRDGGETPGDFGETVSAKRNALAGRVGLRYLFGALALIAVFVNR